MSRRSPPSEGNQYRQLDAAYRRIIDDTIQRSQHLQSTAVLEQLKQKWIEKTHERLSRGVSGTDRLSSAYFQSAAGGASSDATRGVSRPPDITRGSQVVPQPVREDPLYVPKLDGISSAHNEHNTLTESGPSTPGTYRMSMGRSSSARASAVSSLPSLPTDMKASEPPPSKRPRLQPDCPSEISPEPLKVGAFSFSLKKSTTSSFSRPTVARSSHEAPAKASSSTELISDVKTKTNSPEQDSWDAKKGSEEDDEDWGETEWETVKKEETPPLMSPVEGLGPCSPTSANADLSVAEQSELTSPEPGKMNLPSAFRYQIPGAEGSIPQMADVEFPLDMPFGEYGSPVLDSPFPTLPLSETDSKVVTGDASSSDLDDVSDLDDEDPTDCTDLVVAQFDSVQRPHSRKASQKGLWRVKLRHGILQIGQREVLFNSLSGEFSF